MARLRQIENCTLHVAASNPPKLGGDSISRRVALIDFETVKPQTIEASDDYLASQHARNRKTQRLCVAFALIVIVYFAAQFARAAL